MSLDLPEEPAGQFPNITLSFASQQWFAHATTGFAPDDRTDRWYERRCSASGSEFLRWPNLFEFIVSHDGRSIVWRFLDRATVESFQTYLLAPVLSFALVKQGFEPLHATAVVIEGKALALLGDSGSGKSTMAAAFVHAGHQILTDDLLMIREMDGILYGFPGPTRIKLFPEVARRFFPNHGPCPLMNPESGKLLVPLESSQSTQAPAPLHGFLLLKEPDERLCGSHIDRLSGTQSFLELVRSTFNARISSPDRRRRQFRAVQEWAARIPVRALTYPRSLAALEQVLEDIVSKTCSVDRVPT